MDDSIVNLYKERKINLDMVYQFAQDAEAIKNKLAIL